MRAQQQIWTNEHTQIAAIPGMSDTNPSKGVEWFFEEVKPKRGKLVDIGCGKGRNSVFASRKGLTVIGIDYVEGALEKARELAIAHSTPVSFINSAIDEPWPFDDNFFEYAIDCYSSIDIETREGREKYKAELLRTLKPNGRALVMVVSSEDEIEHEMIAKYPGQEKNSAVWPNGKFQKDYDKEELLDFYKNFKVIQLKENSKRAHKLGRDYVSKNFWAILQKL
jgi:SAM-dependent methyltransferase